MRGEVSPADQSLRDLRLGAEYGRAQALQQLGRFDDVMHACAGIRREFGADRRVTALTAMLETGGYRGLGQHKKAVRGAARQGPGAGPAPAVGEAAAVMDTVLARYGQDTDPVLIEMSARARSNKIALGQIGTAAAP
jgi:hypothetical protein